MDAATSETIAQCERLIRPFIRRTPVVQVDGAEFGLPGHTLTLKLELLQHSGSFKARGAFANLADPRRAAGRRGRGVRRQPWRGGRLCGDEARQAGQDLRAKHLLAGEAAAHPGLWRRPHDRGRPLCRRARRQRGWAQQTGALPVPAFDQNETIIGQGTLGLELAGQAPDIDTLLVAVGGGGLIAGIAAWYAGRIKVIGVEPQASPTLTRAFEAGQPVDAEAGGLAADSLAPRRVGERVFPIVQKYARQTVLVSDAAIADAQATLWRALRIVAEPGGAAAFAAVLSGAYRPVAGERVAVIISGGNTAAVNFDLTY